MTMRTTKTTDKPFFETINYKKILNFGYVLICGFLLYKIGVVLYNRKILNDATKKVTACPAILSIARSSRDTLIIMKAEPLCNKYVLETIK